MPEKKLRQAPPEHARDHVGEYRQGNDGQMWFSSPTAKRWVRVSKTQTSKKIKKTQTSKKPNQTSEKKEKKEKKVKNFSRSTKVKKYKIWDNGGTPFHVYVSGTRVEIYKVHYDLDTDTQTQDTKPCLVFEHVQQVFIGKSPLNAMTRFSGGYGRNLDGNSILLHLSGLTYVFIGWMIQQFQAIAPIVKYVSPVGNSSVPYPFAIDSEKRFYFMIENQYIDQVPKEYQPDPYDYLYGHHDDKMSRKAKSKWFKKWPSMKMKTLVERNF